MKLYTLLAAALLFSSLSAQNTVTISTAPGNADQVHYSLQNGVVQTAPLANWDLAFETAGITGSILVNTAKGIKVYKAPFAIGQWAALDTAGLASGWVPQQNSETNWSSGALNQGLTSNPFDLGWGIYNMVTHTIAGDSLFVLHLADGSWKKLRVDGYLAATNAFTFTWADLDGGAEQVGNIVRSDYSTMNFGYYSLANNMPLAQEPAADTWDLLFTKYLGFVPQPAPTFYPVAGCLQNREVTALQVDGVPTNMAQWTNGTFSSDMNVIGFDWKNFNMTSFMWEYAQDRTYFVNDRQGNIWKLIFTAYGGGADGSITFTQELMSATDVNEVDRSGTAVLYPNPSNSGIINVVLDIPSNQAQLAIVDVNGRTVLTQRLTAVTKLGATPVDISSLTAGMYSVRVAHANGMVNSKLIVQ